MSTEASTEEGPLVSIPDGAGRAAAVGVVAGAIVLCLQYVAWSLFVGGPLSIPEVGSPAAEPAVFVAVGVALPAGAVALLFDDDARSGVATAATVLAGGPLVDAVFALPPWQFEGVLGAAVVLAVVVFLQRATGDPAPVGK